MSEFISSHGILHILTKRPNIKLVHLLTDVWVTKLSAGNSCIKSTPEVITHSAPPVVHTHLYSSLGWRRHSTSTTNKSDVSMGTTCIYSSDIIGFMMGFGVHWWKGRAQKHKIISSCMHIYVRALILRPVHKCSFYLYRLEINNQVCIKVYTHQY